MKREEKMVRGTTVRPYGGFAKQSAMIRMTCEMFLADCRCAPNPPYTMRGEILWRLGDAGLSAELGAWRILFLYCGVAGKEAGFAGGGDWVAA